MTSICITYYESIVFRLLEKMRRQPLKVANASTGIVKLKVVMSDDIRVRVPKNFLMTKNNTIEDQRFDINN